MTSFIRLTDFTREDIFRIFKIADEIADEKYKDFLKRKTVVMFFPDTSIRTRLAFERGVFLLGGQTVVFPPATLDKKESLEDVAGYLANWADALVIRHRDIGLLEKMKLCSSIPVINAMTDANHPCEILSDLYALSKRRPDFLKDEYLFWGGRGNIGMAWREAAEALGLRLSQCCPAGWEMEGVPSYTDPEEAMAGKDIICTDSFPGEALKAFSGYQITPELMKQARAGAMLNPCPPFYRGEEVTEEVISSGCFVGYGFKKCLLTVQQAILLFCMDGYTG